MADPTITSPSNPRLKGLVALRRRRVRDETGTSLVEGAEELGLALDAGVASLSRSPLALALPAPPKPFARPDHGSTSD